MKYSELISFNPIEDVIQLTAANDSDLARGYVETYVMSDAMSEALQAPVIDQLQMDEVIDNKGILVVGNYGTGKSHLMSVISSVASDANNLQYLRNRNFAKRMEPVAGKFETLRIEIGGVTMPLRDILFGFIEDDFAARGINFKAPNFSSVRDNKKLIKDMMAAFASKYPDKGYLIVVDEFLAYLTSRDERQIVLDLEFFRALGEMCSKSKLRVIFGVQEKIFDNPKFSFVSDTLKHVSDRFSQIIITKEATSYVVSERILKKTPEQKALIRKHLEQFTGLYAGMSSKLEEFVDLFPIHPSYFDVFNKIYLIENRHILKNISLAIKNVFHACVPEDAPGLISFDDYWPAIKSNGLLKSDVTISRVVSASGQLEEIINRSFPRPAYKPLAIRIIYALSVHRLTTNGLDVQFGLTAENLKDDLCLFLPIPEQDADFLLGAVKTTLKAIMTTVSGQFIIHNDSNDQYYIDVDKVIDYDEKIKQKASIMADGEFNRYFYKAVYYCLEWEAKQYVSGFEIYEHDLNWDSHNIFREGYFFMGLPGERSTAQPERDFYIHILPPYGGIHVAVKNLPDEVYLTFKSKDEFKDTLSLYAAAAELARISEGKDRDAYSRKAEQLQKKLVKFLGENKNTCFDVTYQGQRRQMIEVLKGHYRRDMAFNETIDLAASILLDDYFSKKYPEFPTFKTKITRKNMAEHARAAIDHFAGRKTQQSVAMLQSLGVLDGDKIRPEGSKYAAYYIDKLKKLPPQGVLNYSDLFDTGFMDTYDKRFHISSLFTPIIFLSLVYAGYAVLTLKNGVTLSAANLDTVPKLLVADLREFKYVSRPTQISMAELKKLFDLLDINPALLDNPNDREKGVEELLKKAQAVSNEAVMANQKLSSDFELWGEPLANAAAVDSMRKACAAVQKEFGNYSAKFNTPAKLNNFSLSLEDLDRVGENIRLTRIVGEYMKFKTDCASIVGYLANIEYMSLGADFKADLEAAKADFRKIRDSLMDGGDGEIAAQKAEQALSRVKREYIDIYFEEHKKKRLDINDAKRRGRIQESATVAALKKLRSIEIVSSAKLSQIEQDLSALRVCYELTPEELKANPICPHCRYSVGDPVKNVHGQLDDIESRIDALAREWTKTLLDTVSDPIVSSQMEYLSDEQRKAVDDFLTSGELPRRVDDFFVKAIGALLKGFDPVVIDAGDLLRKLEQLPPMDESAFHAKLREILSGYTKGKDASKLRIVVKRKESEG